MFHVERDNRPRKARRPLQRYAGQQPCEYASAGLAPTRERSDAALSIAGRSTRRRSDAALSIAGRSRRRAGDARLAWVIREVPE